MQNSIDHRTATPPATDSEPPTFTLWTVLRRPESSDAPAEALPELEQLVAEAADEGATIRGFYDVSGLRADADLMIWLHGQDPAQLQATVRRLRRTELLRPLRATWNAMGVHREAEFTRSHVPAFMRGRPPAAWVTVYPFVRSYDWYLLPDEERRALLAEHGRAGSAYKSVLTNTVASFALGDYEWILPLEADDLIDLVDMMRALRATRARLHVREETPFFTGRLLGIAEIPELLA